MQAYEKINNCLLCNGPISLVYSFGDTPLANEFSDYKHYIEDEHFPLNLVECKHCFHVQLDCIVNPDRLFKNYLYASGTSKVTHEYFKKYAESIIKEFSLKDNDLVCDIGSNDGLLLSFFEKAGMEILGFDPAENIAKKANETGIPTITDFFTFKLAKQIVRNKGFNNESLKFNLFNKAKVILSNNCFAHIKDLNDIIKGVYELLDDDGVFVFENSYLIDTMSGTWDTVYHEHIHYHSIYPLIKLFKKHNMKIFDVERTSNQGGSIRVFVCKNNSNRVVDNSIYKCLELESELSQKFEDFTDNITSLTTDLQELLHSLKGTKSIYGYPAKTTTLLYTLDIGEYFENAYEDADMKKNKYSPGLHIPIIPSNQLMQNPPDILFIGAWNFAESLMKKCRSMGYKGRFIVPLPELKEYVYSEELQHDIEICHKED